MAPAQHATTPACRAMICCVIEETPSPLDGGPAACPFVAFEDDRDHRSSAPDYRHRCFAAAEPEPRAFPHQERYCLASAFPQCPVFLDWARQEAAGVRQSGVASAERDDRRCRRRGGRSQPRPSVGKKPHRPSWRAVPGPRRGRPWPPPRAARPTRAPASGITRTRGSTPRLRRPRRRRRRSGSPAVAMARRGPSHPGWENPPRVENFPRLRSRDERRTNQPLLYAAVAVAALMVALIALPILLGNGGKAGPGPSHSPSASAPHGSASASAPAGSPSASTEPGTSYLQYTVKPNDSLSVIAQRFNLAAVGDRAGEPADHRPQPPRGQPGSQHPARRLADTSARVPERALGRRRARLSGRSSPLSLRPSA